MVCMISSRCLWDSDHSDAPTSKCILPNTSHGLCIMVLIAKRVALILQQALIGIQRMTYGT